MTAGDQLVRVGHEALTAFVARVFAALGVPFPGSGLC